MTNIANEREIILDNLIDINEGGKFSHLVLRERLSEFQDLDKQKRSFISRVTQGTLERQIELDYIINQVSKTKVHKMKPVIRNILRSSLYQMKYMDAVPSYAIINEAVKLTKKRGFKGLHGFVNGVLGTLDKSAESMELPSKENPLLYFSVKYSMPEWIVEKWLKIYGEEVTATILERFQQQTGTLVRINENKISKDELMEVLKEENVMVLEHPYLDYALELIKYDNLNGLESFQKGYYQVQDVSSMLVAHIANPIKGDYIIDVCAAPGGKSLHMADKLKSTGMVESRDLTATKVAYLEDNISRTGLTNMRAKEWDATRFDESAIEKADIVLADLPCSGLGIIGKKPDLKYKIQAQSLPELAKLQKQILENVVQYIKPNGKLIYSTCTINQGENERVTKWIEKELGLIPLSIKELLPIDLQKDLEKENQLQLLPGVHQCDGFFIAAFIKKNS